MGDKGLVLSRRCLAVPPLLAFPRPRHTHCCMGTGHWSPARGGEAREREALSLWVQLRHGVRYGDMGKR